MTVGRLTGMVCCDAHEASEAMSVGITIATFKAGGVECDGTGISEENTYRIRARWDRGFRSRLLRRRTPIMLQTKSKSRVARGLSPL
jgi:hypothetical protein